LLLQFSLRSTPTIDNSLIAPHQATPQSWPTHRSLSERASSLQIDCYRASRWSCKSCIYRTTTKSIANNLISSDVLHPNRPNVSKDDLRAKLAEVYKSNKDQINVFGMRTQYGGGKSTGFALIYDSVEAMKKFEPHYRLVRVGFATKIEKASRQQRKQRKNRSKEFRGTAKTKGAKKGKKEK
jgi:small subunit ribosomal protein S24e